MPVAPQCKDFSYKRRVPEQELLHRVLADHLETFLDRTRTEEHELPRHVERELREYLKCGDVKEIVELTAYRIIRLLRRRGVLDDLAFDRFTEEQPILAGMTSASIMGLVATGDRAGRRIRPKRCKPEICVSPPADSVCMPPRE
jgi:hypothetical protein